MDHLMEVEPFQAIELSKLAYRLGAEGRSVLHMEFGQPSTGAPQAALDAARDALGIDPMGYWESPALQARLVQLYRERYRMAAEPDQFLLTCGASPALVLALSARFKAGDRIAMARPGYVAYRNTVRALNMTPVEIECGEQDRFQLTAYALAALDPAPQGVIVASPANPTGTIIAPAELEAIARLCAERGIAIISDEIYHGLSYGAPCRSMGEFAADAMIVSSFSKYYCMPGWRLGWLYVPRAMVERARAYMGSLFLTAPSISQHAALAALDCTSELEAHRATYARNREILLDALPALGLRRIAPPDGAFYIYADVSELTDDSPAFCKKLLLETGLATGPGVDHDPVNGHRFIRLSFAITEAEVQEAVRRLSAWLPDQRRL
ncbi:MULTISPECIES: pyridoxal phosphate-dependent aminotransferase [unclassified Sphingobium]|uniref:pyridoxal phosphate-dependent aminotransferase n=1 Tax=unclassified Sphingobium TaxID=2611147 RepID=UPI0022259B51|nr:MULTISPECIES: aminotransferase class I/II-fold pyridoxal phosphate-dependent enzyme [unclassified Sphingobium]